MAGTDAIFTASRVEFDTKAGEDFDLDQHLGVNYTPEIANILLGGAGEQDASFIALGQCTPRFSVVTPQLKTFLDNIQEAGLFYEDDTGDPGVVFYFQQYAETGPKAGSTHISVTSDKGIVVPRSISAGPLSAQLDFDVIALSSDGLADPLVRSTTATIASAPAASMGYVAGPIDIDGTDLDGIQDSTINLGLTEAVMWGDGLPFATWACPAPPGGRRPTIAFTTTKAGFITSIGTAGAKIASSVTVYLRKLDKGGARVANATAEHIKCTVNEGRIYPANFNGVLGGVIVPTFDGTHPVFVWDTTSAIT